MAIQIPLKKKYLKGGKGRFHGGERPAPLKKRNKLSDAAKRNLPEQRKRCLYVNGKTGRSVMGDA